MVSTACFSMLFGRHKSVSSTLDRVCPEVRTCLVISSWVLDGIWIQAHEHGLLVHSLFDSLAGGHTHSGDNVLHLWWVVLDLVSVLSDIFNGLDDILLQPWVFLPHFCPVCFLFQIVLSLILDRVQSPLLPCSGKPPILQVRLAVLVSVAIYTTLNYFEQRHTASYTAYTGYHAGTRQTR